MKTDVHETAATAILKSPEIWPGRKEATPRRKCELKLCGGAAPTQEEGGMGEGRGEEDGEGGRRKEGGGRKEGGDAAAKV